MNCVSRRICPSVSGEAPTIIWVVCPAGRNRPVPVGSSLPVRFLCSSANSRFSSASSRMGEKTLSFVFCGASRRRLFSLGSSTL